MKKFCCFVSVAVLLCVLASNSDREARTYSQALSAQAANRLPA